MIENFDCIISMSKIHEYELPRLSQTRNFCFIFEEEIHNASPWTNILFNLSQNEEKKHSQ